MSQNLLPIDEQWSRLPIYNAYEFLGAHLLANDSDSGALFRVWAPNAKMVSVVGDFNNWQTDKHLMVPVKGGIWECYISGLKKYNIYKYCITTHSGECFLKADPYAFHTETAPATASKLFNINNYKWCDDEWMQLRQKRDIYKSPVNIYEVHIGSWRRHEGGNTISYDEIAQPLAEYVKEMGYTHVELMPITEFPFDGSWGYQVSGYYAPTSRYGNPDDFKKFVDILHNHGIGIILDWVPAHFPKDAFGLYRFDGTTLYEYADTRKGEHKEWGTCVFDYGRVEVMSFLISSAMFWLKEYHVDGIRVDAVASMLYLDYGRKNGEWCPNKYGGNENLEAVDFLQHLSKAVFEYSSSVMLIAEESTAWPMVTRPTYDGGLGFNFKWNMGWMNDMLKFMSIDPLGRKYNHNAITFSFFYAFSENYILPLSHDEVVYSKATMIGKMFGDYGQKFSSLRTFYAYMMAHPGKKLIFMGQEFAQFSEWRYYEQLDWFLLEYESHRQMQLFVKTLNQFYINNPTLWERDFTWEGFNWISNDDSDQSVIAFRRFDDKGNELIVLCNFVPVGRVNYRVGMPCYGSFKRVFTTNDVAFGGNGQGSVTVKSAEKPLHGMDYSAVFDIPPMSVSFYRCTQKYTKKAVQTKIKQKPTKRIRR